MERDDGTERFIGKAGKRLRLDPLPGNYVIGVGLMFLESLNQLLGLLRRQQRRMRLRAMLSQIAQVKAMRSLTLTG